MQNLAANTADAASFHLSGLPALIVIVVILALIVIGIVTVVKKISGRGR